MFSGIRERAIGGGLLFVAAVILMYFYVPAPYRTVAQATIDAVVMRPCSKHQTSQGKKVYSCRLKLGKKRGICWLHKLQKPLAPNKVKVVAKKDNYGNYTCERK